MSLGDRMVFKRGKLGKLKKLRLLLITLTFQHPSKINISDNILLINLEENDAVDTEFCFEGMKFHSYTNRQLRLPEQILNEFL